MGILKKKLGEMSFNMGGGPVNWFPGHMAAASRAIQGRLKLADFVIEVRDSRVNFFFFSLSSDFYCFFLFTFEFDNNSNQHD